MKTFKVIPPHKNFNLTFSGGSLSPFTCIIFNFNLVSGGSPWAQVASHPPNRAITKGWDQEPTLGKANAIKVVKPVAPVKVGVVFCYSSYNCLLYV